jgi:hypothetical protein
MNYDLYELIDDNPMRKAQVRTSRVSQLPLIKRQPFFTPKVREITRIKLDNVEFLQRHNVPEES